MNQASVSHGPFRELEEGRISPAEYARRVQREVRELIRQSPPPKRPDKNGRKS